MDELERVELLAILDFFAAAPADAAEELDLAVLELDDAAAFSIGIDPKPLLFNRAIGLVETAQLRNVERWFRSRACPLAVSIVSGSGLESALVERNYQPGRTHMKFRRGIDEPPEREPTLRVERIGREHASAFGTVVATVFGAPKPMVRWLAALCGRDGWACFGAFDGDVLVGTGAAYIAGDYAWLGIATTLPDHRGRGSQSAILAARIRAAREAGARVLAVETGDRVDGVAGASFRNLARAGFEEAFRQQWWHPPDEPPKDPRPTSL